MKLSDVAQLLGSDNARAFTEVYKNFEYKDDALLKDYLDFVVHEPVEWMRGFPAKWKSESQFSRVRAAFHKLLKRREVESALGAAYTTEIHDVVWGAFKEHMTVIVTERNVATAKPINELLVDADVESVRSELPTLLVHEVDAESVHSVKKARRPVMPSAEQVIPTKKDLESRYQVLERAFRTLVGGEGDETTRLRQTLLVMMEAM